MRWQQWDLNPYHPSEHRTLIQPVFIVPPLWKQSKQTALQGQAVKPGRELLSRG